MRRWMAGRSGASKPDAQMRSLRPYHEAEQLFKSSNPAHSEDHAVCPSGKVAGSLHLQAKFLSHEQMCSQGDGSANGDV